MKKFLKENIAIVAAIILPLALVAVFMLSTTIRNASVEDPKHDFLIATNYQNNDYDAVRFDVVGGRLVVTYRYPDKDGNGAYMHHSMPRLWRVHVNGMKTEEVSIPLPKDKDEQGKKAVELDIAPLRELKVVNIQPGPDGYTFETASSYYGSPMAELFSYDRHESRAAIARQGRVIPIRGMNDAAYGYYNVLFIGWIADGQ